MASVQDWAARAAHKIVEESKHQGKPREERIAAIIAMFANPLITLLNESRQSHTQENDSRAPWTCPKALDDDEDVECICGADEWNARVDKALS